MVKPLLPALSGATLGLAQHGRVVAVQAISPWGLSPVALMAHSPLAVTAQVVTLRSSWPGALD